jgi:hypothetical protein
MTVWQAIATQRQPRRALWRACAVVLGCLRAAELDPGERSS